MSNRILELLGIRYPVIQGVTGRKTHVELAAAISEHGGLGVIQGLTAVREAGEERRISDPIQAMKKLTSNPFSINVPISLLPNDMVEELIRVVMEEEMRVIITSAGNPRTYTQRLKEANLKVMHVVATVNQAVKAADAGVDAIIAAGFEAGGWQSREEVTTFTLIPQVVDAIKGRIPVIAAGGIGDVRGFLAAFSLGAEGVQIGTRFLASIESSLEDDYKEAILKASDDSTEITGRGERPARNFKVDFLKQVRPGYIRPEAGPSGAAGQVAGLIREVLSVQEIISRMIDGIHTEYDRLGEQLESFIPHQ